MSGVKAQDIVVLLKLASLEQRRPSDLEIGDPWSYDPYSVRYLEAQLGISKTEVSGSIRRSLMLGLAVRDRVDGNLRPNRRRLLEFIIHGLKFVFPVEPAAMTRGMPTGFAAPGLEGMLISGGEYDYVWPTPDGESVGQGVKPLFRTVPLAAARDGRLYEYLALVDAIRIGKSREAKAAQEHLRMVL